MTVMEVSFTRRKGETHEREEVTKRVMNSIPRRGDTIVLEGGDVSLIVVDVLWWMHEGKPPTVEVWV